MKYTLAVAALLATAAAEDTPKTTPTKPKCEVVTWEVYTDVKCEKKDGTQPKLEDIAKLYADDKLVCTDKTKLSCDATAIKTEVFKKTKCEEADTEAAGNSVITWGKCSKQGDKYIKATTSKAAGAKALMASAAIALAFVGSQF